MKPILIFILALWTVPFWMGAQNLLPPIHNYKIFEYQADSKNWGLSANSEGELFVANNSGLLHFNGEKWKLYKLPNKTTIRSVAHIDGKIYTGSYEEFGYWTKNKLGVLDYTSLTHLIKNHVFTSEEFWQILPYGDAILFRSFNGIYVLRNDKIAVIDPPFVVTFISIYKNKILVAGGHKRLYELIDEALIPLEEHELLSDKVIIAMADINEGLLIGTKRNGCYIMTEKEIVPFEISINAQLKQYQLNQILSLSGNKLAFGTIKNGIYLYDLGNKTSQRLNRQVGLQNNTVLSMMQYKEQLWVGLDNGIDRIQLNNPLTYYTDYTGAVGTVYDLAVHENVLYMGSNTGIYYFTNDSLQFVEGSQGHVWDLNVTHGELFCGHNTGTYRVNKKSIEKISTISGGYQIVKVPESNTSFIQGTYIGLAKYEKDANGKWVVTPIAGMDKMVKYLCFEDTHTLWAAHPYKGLYRIVLNDTYDEVIEKIEFTTEQIPTNYNVKVYNIRNQIAFDIEGIWYRYDPILKKIELFKEFQNYNHKSLIHHDNAFFWFIDNQGSKEVLYTDLKEINFVLDDIQLQERLAPEAENIIKLNDSIYCFTLNDGFGQLDLFKFRERLEDFELPKPKLVSFEDGQNPYPLVNELFHVPYNVSHDITVNVSSPSLVQPKYHFELYGPMDQAADIENGVIRFQNLPFGNYELNVSTIRIDNERSDPKTIQFEIAPPWYLSKVSMVMYLLAFIGVVFLIRWYNRQKLEKKHLKLKERFHREQEERLAKQEKEKLEKEIKQKQKELARTTMNMADKNKIIIELKDLLMVNKNQFTNHKRYGSIIKKLDNSINDEGDWKHFEVNFKELHEDFFENLLKKYPKLTPKDLKLCAYLKMNLSSKEIAPLMAITNRGVEIHRYRLRKKLKIESSENLSNFLIKFN
ncbi:MAG: Two component regulator three Y domain-containing protein [Maribacter sp.]|uniref:helix-turn-helix and ligand-binding sensor domain-containing protein n=1 Tax=Maribacter sp. TaxID=1897614 RepID=UPI003C7607C8